VSFTDPAFLFSFLPIALLLFAIVGRFFGPTGAQFVLVGATLVFCLPYGWPFVILLIASSLINQAAVTRLMRDSDNTGTKKRFWLFCSALAFNFTILLVLKYGILFSAIPGAAKAISIITAAIPVTVSFLTFQRAVMVLDAYQQRPEIRTFSGPGLAPKLRFGTFNLMFSNLVIGPIAYASEVAKQLASKNFGKVRRIDLEIGLTLFVFGIAKKVLIADPLGIHIVGPVFSGATAGLELAPVEVIIGMLGFYAQLYFDFSGYSDMALGIARMFGIRLPVNFNSPLRSTGIIDFYKRWHITLTRVIARFMFTPLSLAGTRFAMRHNLKGWHLKMFAVWLPMLVNFEVIALWHGVLQTYLAFGLFHGLWFILETEVRATKRWKAFAKTSSAGLRLRLGQILTFVPMMISFSLFQSSSLESFGHLMSSLGNDWLAIFSDSSNRVLGNREPLMYLPIAFAIIWLLPNAYEAMRHYRPGIQTFGVASTTLPWMRFRWRPTLLWGIFVALLAIFTVAKLNAPVPFVYGGF
jgi:alginate O-acetyltransferase complex protein AlgI